MASDRTTLRTSAAVERRPPAATRVQRSSAETQRSPAETLQSRLGNRATQVLISRSLAKGKESASKHSRLPAKVSKPTDPAELEAEETARKVMQMGQPATKPVLPKGTGTGTKTVQRAEATSAPTPSTAAPAPVRTATPRVTISGGAPLPASVRTHMEPRFGANFSNVRVHTDASAAQQSSRLGANAFTVGEHIFFGKDKFQPQSATGKELIAHELTHTIQQQAVVQRQVEATVTQRSEPRIQRWSISDGLDWIADKANYLPGFRMLTIVLGVNPINMKPVKASPANILRALLEMVPVTGALVAKALDEYGIFDKVGNWIAGQVQALGLVGSSLKSALMEFLESLSWTDIFDLDDVYERGKRIFTAPIDQLIDFITNLITDILVFIRDAILLPLAKLAEGTQGYDLLKAVLGKDPFTGEKVTPTPEVLIGGFMKLIGQEEIWQNAQKANAVPRLWAWFQGALNGLMGFVSQIPDLIISTLESLEIGDLFPPTKAFMKVATAFGGFVMQFITWAGQTVWTLLEIIFDVVSPGALEYVKKTGAALQSILKNPIPFVANLVKAAKLGFDKFSDNFLQHLKAGLIEWLVGAMPGIYIPQAFSLIEIAKFVFSALGLTWENIRQKLVKAIGEPAVKALETTFDIVVTLVTEGPAAAWDLIKDQLAKLKDMVIGGIIDMIVGAVVKKAIPKLIAMFIPGAGFISAILSIYDTVMVFVEKIKKIAAVVKTFVDSIVAIAQGEVGGAAARVERALAGVLSLAINFLAGFAGLGKVADKVMEIINKVRAPIDKALDWLVNWIVTAAKKLGKLVAQAGLPADPKERLKLGMQAAVNAANRFAGKKVGKVVLNPLLTAIKVRYGFKVLEFIPRGNTWGIRGQINPEEIAFTRVIVGTDKDTGQQTTSRIIEKPLTLVFEFRRFTAKQSVSINEMTEGLQHHQNALNNLTVGQWLANIYFRAFLKGPVAAEERDIARRDMIRQLRAEIEAEYQAKGKTLSKSQLEALVKLRAKNTHASHLADFISGGNIDDFEGLERGAVNSYIGSNWGRFRPDLEAYAIHVRQIIDPKDWEKVKMNFRLRIKFLN